jgi:ParB family transcriptional regulator, chromosome partitioning protein
MSEIVSCATSLSGIIDDIEISRIRHPKEQLRTDIFQLPELAASIGQKGLLQPIIVRIKEDFFEIVAGNRRYEACKMLGWRKITCHVEDLDDKEAFEISLMENIQRSTLNPMDEAKAFKAYVSEFGWGGVSDLASKIGKSVSYVTKRIALLTLPPDVKNSIRENAVSTSMGVELCSIKDNNTKSELAFLISQRHLSVRKVRKLVEDLERDDSSDTTSISLHNENKQTNKIQKSLDKSIIVLRIALNRIAMIIEDVKDDCWITGELLLQHKNVVHEQIDILLKQRRKADYRLDRTLR